MFSFVVRMMQISRESESKKIAGVCTGLSKVSDMPIIWLRIFFLIFTPFYGFGPVLYVMLWLFMYKKKKEPEEKAAIKEE
jgi:phage shock protein PspC (stress-responsive transcriptional regulator)